MLVMAPVFFTLIFRTLLYYLDLLHINMCPIEIPAKGQLREVRMKVLSTATVQSSYSV